MATDLPTGSTPPDDRSQPGGKSNPSDWIATPPPADAGDDWLTAENPATTPLPAEPVLGVTPLDGPTSPEPVRPSERPEDVNLDEVADLIPGSDVDLGRMIPNGGAGTSSMFGGGSSLELDLPPPAADGGSELFTGGSSMELPALPEDPSEAPLWGGSSIDLPAVPEDPEDALVDLPPVNPTAPASGWYDTASPDEPTVMPPPPDRPDVFAELDHGESDVIRGLSAPPPPGSSSIFDAPTAGSSRFHNPADATEEVTREVPLADPVGPDSGTNLDVFDSGVRSPSDSGDVLGSDIFGAGYGFGGAGSHPEDSGLDFNQTSTGESGSHLFSDPSVTGRGSGLSEVNLLNPLEDSNLHRPLGPQDSSIFGAADPSNPASNEIPLTGSDDGKKAESIHDFEDDSGGSHIFKKGVPTHRDPGTVSFEMPADRHGPDEVSHDSGQIDWSLPVADDAAVSQLLSEEQAGAAGLSPLGGPTEVEEPAAESNIFDSYDKTPATTPHPVPTARTPAPEPGETGARAARPVRPGSWLPEPEPKARPSSWVPEREAKPAAARRGGAGGWIGGTAIGLFVGMGACAAAYFGGLVPGFKDDVAPVRRAEQPPPPENQMALADAQAALDGADPVRALQIYERSKQDLAPMDRAGRGEARWLALLRKHGADGTAPTANDPELKLAQHDLQAAVDASDKLVGNERMAGVRAALHLGAMKELTGDIAGAAKVYRDAAAKFKDQGHVFQTALTRLQVTQTSARTGRATPDRREELARLALVSLVLLQAPKQPNRPADKKEDEAGFLFWEAVGHAAAGDYARAVAAIDRARGVHEKRRLRLAGRGLNPLSDPLEQIFTRSCDELRDYWKMKADLYAHPVVGPLARQDGLTDALARVLSAEKSTDELTRKLAETAKQLETVRARAEADRKSLTDTAAALETKLKSADQELTKAAAEKDRAQKELAESRKQLDERMKALADAEGRSAEARKKLAAAEAALAVVVRELKANKLVGEQDDPAAVLAKLPEVLKKATATAAGSDAQKAGAALLAARKELDAARADADKAQAQLQAARTDADRANKLAETTTARIKEVQAKFDEKVKEAVAAARARDRQELQELEKESRELAALLQKAQAEYADKLAAKEAEFAARLTAARTGHVVPVTSAEVQNRERAARLFADGASAYLTRRYADAERALDEATRLNPADARYWYFLGMARFDQGKPAGAAFKRGAELEARGMPLARVVDNALEGVYGPAKGTLRSYRP